MCRCASILNSSLFIIFHMLLIMGTNSNNNTNNNLNHCIFAFFIIIIIFDMLTEFCVVVYIPHIFMLYLFRSGFFSVTNPHMEPVQNTHTRFCHQTLLSSLNSGTVNLLNVSEPLRTLSNILSLSVSQESSRDTHTHTRLVKVCVCWVTHCHFTEMGVCMFGLKGSLVISECIFRMCF